jgi:asparagine N-glycosylation enzyme membrane subunit Stt3
LETTDKIAIGVLALILVATAVASKPGDRYFFVVVLVVYLIYYIINKRRDAGRRKREALDYEWREEAAEEAYWGDIGGPESPEAPQGE